METSRYFFKKVENKKVNLAAEANRVNLEPIPDPEQISDKFVIRNS